MPTYVHGKDTFISLNAVDLSPYITTSQIEPEADTHDITTYGKSAHVFQGGLKNGSASMAGIYATGTAASNPKLIIQPLVGSTVVLIRKPEGAGSGKPIDTVNVVVKKYTETNPVADMITFAVDMQMSDTLALTTGT